MKDNLIIKFDIDIDVKILLNDNIIGESGYKDTFKTTIEEDGLLTVKHGRKKANIRVLKEQINNISITYSADGQLKATFVSNNSLDKKENNKENNKEKENISEANNIIDNNVTGEKSNESAIEIVSGLAAVIIVGLLICFFILPYFFNNDCDSRQCRFAEQKALEDVPELGFAFSTVKSNELKCKTDSITDDEIVLVKCTTTNEELLDYYGSSTIWYGYLESASGSSYFRWADPIQSNVLSKLRQ